MQQPFLLVLGVFLFAIGCRTFRHPAIRKAGALALLGSTFLAGFFLGGESILWGVCATLLWFFLPLLDILTRIRSLRLPLDKTLCHRNPPNRDEFPHLANFSREVEAEGYTHATDTGWDWDDMSQFVRAYYNEESKAQAGIYFNEQRHIAFTYIGISTRTRDGRIFTSWNYPFSNTMHVAPEFRFNRVSDVSNFSQLIDAHETYLITQGIGEADIEAIDPEEIRGLMEKELRQQIDHNLDKGVIRLSGNGTFKYSWRGLVFLWCQFVKDMVKLG